MVVLSLNQGRAVVLGKYRDLSPSNSRIRTGSGTQGHGTSGAGTKNRGTVSSRSLSIPALKQWECSCSNQQAHTYSSNDKFFPRIRSKQFSAWLCRVKFFDFSIFEGQKSKCVDFFEMKRKRLINRFRTLRLCPDGRQNPGQDRLADAEPLYHTNVSK